MIEMESQRILAQFVDTWEMYANIDYQIKDYQYLLTKWEGLSLSISIFLLQRTLGCNNNLNSFFKVITVEINELW